MPLLNFIVHIRFWKVNSSPATAGSLNILEHFLSLLFVKPTRLRERMLSWVSHLKHISSWLPVCRITSNPTLAFICHHVGYTLSSESYEPTTFSKVVFPEKVLIRVQSRFWQGFLFRCRFWLCGKNFASFHSKMLEDNCLDLFTALCFPH